MFVLKKANVLCKFTNTLNSIRWTFYAKNFATIVDNQTKVQSQIPQLKHIMSIFPYMKSEMQKQPEYMQVFPDCIRELSDYKEFTLKPNNFKAAEDHYLKMLDYVLCDGHRDQLMMLTNMYQDLMVNKEMSTENIKQAHLLGWSLEILLGALIIDDDILFENSERRHGKTCWHKIKGMANIAVNDMLMLENGCYLILNRFFSHLPCYNGIMQTVSDCFMTSLLSKAYEFQSNEAGLERFTLDHFNHMNLLKASYHRFYMPAAIAMLLAGYDFNMDKKSFETVKLISHEIGPFYQAQNDYLDCFANQSGLNKSGRDIRNGQFTWLSTMAMELGTEQQKDIMRTNYGKNDADCVAKVKQLYKELHLPELYHEYKERNRNNVMHQFDQLLHSDETLRNACINYFSQVYEMDEIALNSKTI